MKISEIIEKNKNSIILVALYIPEAGEKNKGKVSIRGSGFIISPDGKNLPEDLKNDEKIKGILKIKTQIKDFLKSQGVEEIECLGKKFDPNLHEVVEEVNKEGVEPGTVIEEIRKGYKINGRLLRPAKVRVTK